MWLGQTRWACGYTSRVLINEKRKVVWRYGLGQTGERVRRNYQWLQQAYPVLSTPQPISTQQIGPLVVTSESYLVGQPLKPHEITSEMVATILRALTPLYGRYGKEQPGAYITLIHGDLTHRNILSGPAGLSFLDGDRSEMAPPEFDVWLLVADAMLHRSTHASHRLFLRQVWHSRPTDVPYRDMVQKLYEAVPAAAVNEALWETLWSTFVARCLVHSISDCVRRRKPLDFLDGLT